MLFHVVQYQDACCALYLISLGTLRFHERRSSILLLCAADLVRYEVLLHTAHRKLLLTRRTYCETHPDDCLRLIET